MAEEAAKALAKAAEVFSNLTVKGQTNAANKTADTVIENLTKLSLAGILDVDTLLEKINNLEINKEFGLWRGHQKKAIIKLGDASK